MFSFADRRLESTITVDGCFVDNWSRIQCVNRGNQGRYLIKRFCSVIWGCCRRRLLVTTTIRVQELGTWALSISWRLIHSQGLLLPLGHFDSVSLSFHCPHGEGMRYSLFSLFDYIYSCFWLFIEMINAFVIFLDRFGRPCFARELIHFGVFAIVTDMFIICYLIYTHVNLFPLHVIQTNVSRIELS